VLEAGEDEGPGPTVRYWRKYMGVTHGLATHLGEISPADHASQADAPIMLIHGTKDSVVPYEQTTEMLSRLRNAGKPVEFAVLPDQDHWLQREPTRIAMLNYSVGFVEKYNPPN